MDWWKSPLYDTLSLIRVDQLLSNRVATARHFLTMLAIEVSLSPDQMEDEIAQRIMGRVEFLALPAPADLAAILEKAALPKSLSSVDALIYATAVRHQVAVITEDKRLTVAIRSAGLIAESIPALLKELAAPRSLASRR